MNSTRSRRGMLLINVKTGEEEPMSKAPPIVPSQLPASTSWINRRNFLIGAGAAGMTLGAALGRTYTQIATAKASWAW
jgi:hypothetical protein